jgi:hypothetical protein
MVALIDSSTWRTRTAVVGCGTVIGGLALLSFTDSRFGWALVVGGSVLALWAWLHKTRGEFPLRLSTLCVTGDHEACIGAVEIGMRCGCPCHYKTQVSR